MVGKIVIEAIIYTLVNSLAMLMLFKVQGARRQLYNYPLRFRSGQSRKALPRRKR